MAVVLRQDMREPTLCEVNLVAPGLFLQLPFDNETEASKAFSFFLKRSTPCGDVTSVHACWDQKFNVVGMRPTFELNLKSEENGVPLACIEGKG